MYLILYDITENKLRTKVSRLLEQEGYERLQYSVFIAPYNPLKNKLWEKLNNILGENTLNKIYCIKITRENFYNVKIIGNLDFKLKYLAGEASSLIL